jgi:streptogramin lyase
VNLRGDVAVTNRRGSVTKIAANLDDCVDANGDGDITTSQAADDVLPWGEDECVLWHHDTGFDEMVAGSQGGPRGTAWTGGTYDEETCETVDANVWVGWRNQPDQSVTVRLIDGDDGTTVGEALIDDWPCNWGHGPYGGAADAEGNYWGLGTAGSMFRIDVDDFSVERWDNPDAHVMYGIALDAEGSPWIAGWSGNLWKFDRAAEEWVDKGAAEGGPTRMRGLAIDKDGYAWIAGNNPCGLVQYDTQSDTLVNPLVALPDCGQPVGVSIDVDGAVWVVDRDADRAYKVDPTDYAVTTVEGLVDPYTYSDMTGAGLGLVVNPPG